MYTGPAAVTRADCCGLGSVDPATVAAAYGIGKFVVSLFKRKPAPAYDPEKDAGHIARIQQVYQYGWRTMDPAAVLILRCWGGLNSTIPRPDLKRLYETVGSANLPFLRASTGTASCRPLGSLAVQAIAREAATVLETTPAGRVHVPDVTITAPHVDPTRTPAPVLAIPAPPGAPRSTPPLALAGFGNLGALVPVGLAVTALVLLRQQRGRRT